MSAGTLYTPTGTRVHISREPHSVTALEILHAAVCDFDEVGFAAASIGHIAEHAGKSKSLVTYHFPTKALLAAAILNQAHPAGVFMGVDRQEDNPLEAILAAAGHVASSVAHNALARVALKLREEPEVRYQGSPAWYYGWLARIADYLDEARRTGLICAELDVGVESRFCVAGVVGLVTMAMHTADYLFLEDDVVLLTRQRIGVLMIGQDPFVITHSDDTVTCGSPA